MVGSKELSLYKGKDLALPYLTQDLVPVNENKELVELKQRRERWSAVPKEDRRESVREYIKNTRSILLAKIAMTDKRREAGRMQEYIKQKESVLNLNKEIYEQDKKMVNEYVEFMKEKADKQKSRADRTTKERKEKEEELERLIRFRTDLKKKLGDSKEQCGLYKGYVDFIFSLNPEIEQQVINRKKERANRFFVTEPKLREEDLVRLDKDRILEADDEELKEIRKDYGISDNDSDTEIPSGFNSVGEMLALMHKQAAENLTLIQDVQKIDEKTKVLTQVRNDLKELAEEEKRKASRLNELTLEAESDSHSIIVSSEDKKSQNEKVRILKDMIEKIVLQIKNICNTGKSVSTKLKDLYSEVDGEKSLTATLEYVTEYLRKLKMVRDWKFINAARHGGTSELVDQESKKNDEMKQIRAEAARKKNQNAAEKKKADLIADWKIPRFRKYGKEMLKRRVLKDGQKTKTDSKEEKVEDEFDDKYFVDY